MKKFLLVAAFVTLSCISVIASPIIPEPQSFTKQGGTFEVTQSTNLCCNVEELKPLVGYIKEYLNVATATAKQSSNCISLTLDKSLAVEAYRLSVKPTGITIVAGGYGGAFNGVQTLFQLLPSEIYKKNLPLPAKIECCEVDDAPRFPFRGFMLDVVRTWSPKEWVKQYIDYIAYHKINKLHLHLTDSQGWRLEIKSHPKLTQIGGFRGGDSPIQAQLGKWNEKYGGYYTQNDIREIIAYAKVRNIEIIPEIDLPGHSWTFTKIYPQSLCKNRDGSPLRGGGVVCATHEENFKIFDDIFREVAALFPSQYIHIGGDEVKFAQWQKCPSCSAWMNENGDADPRKLQIHFMRQIHNIIAKYDKKPVMWYFGGEMLEGSIVQGWQKASQSKLAADSGYHTVIMPADSFYLDIYQSKYEDGFRSRPPFDIKHLYSFDLAENGFTEANLKYVDGFEAPFWSELFLSHNGDKSLDYIEYMTFPRLCGLAEQGWGKNGGAWENFYSTLVNHHYDRMAAMGINFRLMPPTVKYENGMLVASVDDNSKLYYKRDGDSKQRLYTKPIKCKSPVGYLFWSEYKGISSFVTAHASHYETVKPNVTLTSSIPGSAKYGYGRTATYHKDMRPARPCKKGDWFLFEFEEPVKCRAIEFITGNKFMPKRIISEGYLEVSKDGKKFKRVGELTNGWIRLVNPGPIKAARMVSESDNGNIRISSPMVYAN